MYLYDILQHADHPGTGTGTGTGTGININIGIARQRTWRTAPVRRMAAARAAISTARRN